MFYQKPCPFTDLSRSFSENCILRHICGTVITHGVIRTSVTFSNARPVITGGIDLLPGGRKSLPERQHFNLRQSVAGIHFAVPGYDEARSSSSALNPAFCAVRGPASRGRALLTGYLSPRYPVDFLKYAVDMNILFRSQIKIQSASAGIFSRIEQFCINSNIPTQTLGKPDSIYH